VRKPLRHVDMKEHIAERGAIGFRKHKRHHARKAPASEA
jgi:hypothetical protein